MISLLLYNRKVIFPLGVKHAQFRSLFFYQLGVKHAQFRSLFFYQVVIKYDKNSTIRKRKKNDNRARSK